MFSASKTQKAFILFLDVVLFVFFSAALFLPWVPGATVAKMLSSLGFWFVLFTQVFSSYVLGAFELSEFERKTDIFKRVLFVGVITLSVVISVHYLGAKERSGIFSRPVLIGVLFAQIVSAYLIRLIWRSAHLKKIARQKWLFLVPESAAASIQNDIHQKKLHFDRVFCSSWKTEEVQKHLENRWTGIVVGLPRADVGKDLVSILVNEKFKGSQIMDLVGFYEKNFLKLPVFFLEMDWFTLADGFRLVSSGFYVRLKRLQDLLLSVLLLAMTIPIQLILFVLIPLESKGSALFQQVRTGKDGRPFFLFKFRSMSQDAEKAGPVWASKNDSRVTRLGGFLRKTRLDELPQLWNVLRGEMSLIGPRPERPEFNAWLEKEIPFYQFRHAVRPGITGWAQIHYPYGASIEDAREKLQFELWYMKNFSLLVDAIILLKTAGVVFFRKGR